VTATFATAFDTGELRPGGVALLTQSGAFASFVFGLGRAAGVDFGFLATTGNEMDLTISELLGAVIELPSIDSVLLHVEGIRDPERFRAAAARARELGKPIAIVKVGRSAEGAAAARAHTDSDTGDDAAYDAIFEEFGIHRVESMSDLAEAAQIFQARTRPCGPRITIVSVSGGTGVLMADLAVAEGLEVPVLPGAVRADLATVIPPFGSTRNPVDVTGGVFDDLPTFEAVLRCCTADDSTDMLLVAVGNAAATEVQLTRAIIAAASSGTKPTFVAWVGGGEEATRRLNEAGVPTFSDPSRAVRAAALAARLPVRETTESGAR
jgi:acetate---CoA ligase (ADP-forming)